MRSPCRKAKRKGGPLKLSDGFAVQRIRRRNDRGWDFLDGRLRRETMSILDTQQRFILSSSYTSLVNVCQRSVSLTATALQSQGYPCPRYPLTGGRYVRCPPSLPKKTGIVPNREDIIDGNISVSYNFMIIPFRRNNSLVPCREVPYLS